MEGRPDPREFARVLMGARWAPRYPSRTRRAMPHWLRGHNAGGGELADVKLFLSCVSDEFGDDRIATNCAAR